MKIIDLIFLSKYINIYGLNIFLVPQVLVKFGISHSSKLVTNLALHLKKIRGFSSFNQILLSLSDVSSAFHYSI